MYCSISFKNNAGCRQLQKVVIAHGYHGRVKRRKCVRVGSQVEGRVDQVTRDVTTVVVRAGMDDKTYVRQT